jgi:hypothetical protein
VLRTVLAWRARQPGPPPSLQAYLASESEEEDGEEDGGAGPEEDEEAIRQRYRMLLADGAPNTAQERHGKKDWVADDDEEGSAGRSGSDSEAQQEAGTTRVKGDKGKHTSQCCALLCVAAQPQCLNLSA